MMLIVNVRKLLLNIEEAKSSADYAICENCSIVGMTTTGAAKYNALVRKIQPKIVIVEEAAEIIEAHLLAALTPTVKQLILIGKRPRVRGNMID